MRSVARDGRARRSASTVMRVQRAGTRPAARLLLCALGVAVLAFALSGSAFWCWTQSARLTELDAPMRLSRSDAGQAMWRLIAHGSWSSPARGFVRPQERVAVPPMWAYAVV